MPPLAAMAVRVPPRGLAEGAAVLELGPNAGQAGAVTISQSTFDHNQDIAGNGGNSGPGQVDTGVDEAMAPSPILAAA